MSLPRGPGVALVLGIVSGISVFCLAPALNIPQEVLDQMNIEQLPTITAQSPSLLIAFPFEESFSMKCEGKGNPEPTYRWTKNGLDFDPMDGDRLVKEENSGTFSILNKGNLTQYQGKYRCHASNKLGTAISEESEFIVPHVPKFPKEKIEPLKVEEGKAFVLECNPPKGIPPMQIYWMTIGLQHIEQDERVSMGLNGNLYFSNAQLKDSRRDYCCYASFPRIRTIVQKNAMSVIVSGTESVDPDSDASANAILERKPSLLVPPADEKDKRLVKGDKLELECIAEGFPTPRIEWTKVGQNMPEYVKIENYGKLLVIAEVDVDDEGKYMCKAINLHGEAVHSFHVTVEAPPQWIIEPKGMLATIGSNVDITCSARGLPQPTITWRMNGQLLKDTSVANRELHDDTIVLRNAKPNNSAVYQCEASNRHGTLLANANVMVMNLRPMITTENNQDYVTTVGSSVVMPCEVFSSPASVITWTKDDTTVPVEEPRFTNHENGSLEIHTAEKEDMGLYTCLATNTEGKAAIMASLDIKDPTRIVDGPQDLKIRRGSTVQFNCQAEYDESFRGDFEVLWEKDGVALASNITENAGLLLDDGILQIVGVSHKDQGTYKCRALTPLDEDSASAKLIVLDVPDAPQDVVVSEHKKWNATLKWIPGDEHNSATNEFVIEYEESKWEPGKWKELQRVPGNRTSALLKLQGHVHYQFRVYAINSIGKGPPSAFTDRIRTPPSAPDKNPENIKIEGHLPHEMDIIWEPLLPIEHNGPGFEYKVSYRPQGSGEDWEEKTVTRHSYVVKNTPTFVPYEVKIQSRNTVGWGPEPAVVTGYSGEDIPTAAPGDVDVDVVNSTLIKVSWTPVPKDKLNGRLGGYRVNCWRLRSLLDSKKARGVKQSMVFPDDRDHGMVPGLKPFSEYSLQVMAFNGRGNSPSSPHVTFSTPEGVPEKSPFLKATNVQKDSLTLVWTPPREANGVHTGYLLQYQLINDTGEVGELQTVNITGTDTTKWVLEDLEPYSRYKFYLQSCTKVGCGPPVSEEGTTDPNANLSSPAAAAPAVDLRKSSTPSSTSTPVSAVANATLASLVPILLNISSSVSDKFAKISWIPRSAQKESEFYVAYMNNRNGNWKISEAVNTSQSFHIIEGLEPGTEYTVRLMTKNWVDNSSIFEDVITTMGTGPSRVRGGISTQGWFIGVMSAVALLTLIALIACFVNRNKGGKYSVKEKEDMHPDLESHGIHEDTFCEYSDNDEKPLKGSLQSLSGDTKAADSGDSLVDYGEEDGQFNEDGSFIGEYAGHKRRESMEIKGMTQSTA